MQITGKIIKIMPVFSGTSKGSSWSKVCFTVKDSKKYGDEFAITALNDSIAQLEGITEGTFVSVIANCRVKEFKGVLYQNCTLYRISRCNESQQYHPDTAETRAGEPPTGDNFGNNEPDCPW